jgi:indolepyruvate ferredoxin oxidoreductase beta subunit
MLKSKTLNILFCGTGGQGVLTAAEVCGLSALFEGYHVKKSEVHGMAQRGGSVESHLRFGKQVFSPLIPEGGADYLVCFDQAEGERLKNFLAPKGINLIQYLGKAQAALEDKRYVNTYLLGVLSKYLPIKEENWLKALEQIFSSKNLAENKRIFLLGKSK